MFNIITSFKNRNIIGNISLDELVEQIKNPSHTHEKVVDKAREIGKGSKRYNQLKESLPCFVPNFSHKNGYVDGKSIDKPTGFLYIDVDYEISINYEEFNFIVASWKSLSGIGNGILVAINNLPADLKSIRDTINTVSSMLDIKPDSCAISVDRLCAIAYDKNIYYNKNFNPLSINIEINKEVENIVTKTKKSGNSDTTKKNNIYKYRLEHNYHFSGDNIRYSNLDDYTKDLEFKSDELFKDFSNNKIRYAEVYIPNHIKNGNRNTTIFKIASIIKALNKGISNPRITGVIRALNKRCEEPLDNSELDQIIKRILNTEFDLFANKEKTYIFNPDYMLTGKERQSIASKENGKKRSLATKKTLIELVENWNTDKDGKYTMKALSIKAGMCYKTIRNYKYFLKK